MNIKSIEYGWIIKEHGLKNPRQIPNLIKYKDRENTAHTIPETELELETHPCDPTYMFFSVGCMEDKGYILPSEPIVNRNKVRKWVKEHMPKSQVAWGVIETER